MPARAVAALFLERQHLERPRANPLTAARLTRFAEDVGGIQLDTINVVDRAHYLTLWSRFGPYRHEALDRLVYRQQRLFEYWAHAACLVPMSHVRYWRHVMDGYGGRQIHSTYWHKWVRANQRVIDHVLAEIDRRGPLSNADFEHQRKRKSTGWWDRKPQAHALDYLWMSGKLAVHSRTHFQKRYDLAERLVPEMSAHAAPEVEEFRHWHTRQSLHGMGAASETDLRMYLTFPRITIAERRRTLEAMRTQGELAEVEIEGVARHGGGGRWLILRDDLPALERAQRRRQSSLGTTLLSPFDSLLWHRERVRALFGYDYRIEVYVPAPRRRHGYYSLPILHDGQLIGRVDPKTWREQRRLEVRAAHFEPWFAKGDPAPTGAPVDRDAALAGVAEALASLASFLGAEAVTVGRISPSILASPLRKLVKSSPIPVPRPRRAGDIDGGDS